MSLRSLLPAGLARRFALSSAGLAALALLLTALTSWWLISRQHEQALDELAARERQFHATMVERALWSLASRAAEMAGSTILATGLVDSAGKETYLGPYLAGVRQISGIPVQVLFTDFEGKEIASNPGANFSVAQRAWLRSQLDTGRRAATIMADGGGGFELVAMEPLKYARTQSSEGALLYKISLDDIQTGGTMRLEWGAPAPRPGDASTPVRTPDVFAPLAFTVRGALPSHEAQAHLSPEYLPALVLALVLFAAVVLAGRHLAVLLTRDVRALESFASRLVSSGLTQERAPVGGAAEVASLARSINRMLDRLFEQHDALTREGEKLAQLAAALKTNDRRKDEFLAMLAHELRNPLAPITSGAELLKLSAPGDARVARTSDIISRQARHMTKLVDDLLDVSRVTRGLVSLNKVPLDFAQVVGAAVDQARPLIEARRQRLAMHLPPGPAPVLADQARLLQVVSNLLNNAAKYTPEGGHIELALERDGASGEAVLTVRDDGNGISPELMPEIFDLFTQGARSADRSQGGLGLGLALVRNLVELHGGSVTASSPGVGQGSTFTVRLPGSSLPLRGPAGPTAAPDARTPLRLLLVDDNVDAGLTLATLLRLDGHEVRVAHDGPSALAQAEDQVPDVFILDIGLPGMDGFELARRLRAMPATQSARLVALTGYGQAGDRERSKAAGFDEHLVKPVDPQELDAVLGRMAG